MASNSFQDEALQKMTSKSMKRHGIDRHFNNELLFLSNIAHKNIIRVIESA